ncbi:MAG: efflux RND transporter periplasmic adaptor subunit [Acidobacteria bacterium]|nr:efflux RND transporter periplasmic adaptor subunit [Acidobacteriota bacterium]MCL5288052.1 efflux RND transporter periplasmic adaptor subunit [Acidobacteriota bacterium]
MVFILPLILLAACSKSAPPAKTAEQSVTLAVTRWSDKTELFMENPPLVASENARFAVHFTDLRNFNPLTQGKVTIELRSAAGRSEIFQTEAPSSPGIFGVTVKPSAAGNFSMTVRLDSPTLKDTHELGEVQVYADARAAAKAEQSEEGEVIRFLKEQQWTLDFATVAVGERALRESVRVPAEVRPRTGGEAEIVAPVAGRLSATSAIPAVGTLVQKGQVLARIIPRTATPSDRATLDLALSEAKTALSLARRDRERAERLVTAGAVPAKRLDEAKAAEATAQARLDAAQARLAQHESSRSADGDTPDGSQFVLRAPIAGIVAASHGMPGASVEEGESLFRIVTTDPVFIVASVPEGEAGRLRQLAGGELELTGQPSPMPLGRVVTVGRVVDAASRTLPVIFEVRNPDARLAVGQSVFVRLFTSTATKELAVPESAIVDDAGRPVVFVQVAGESFARRAVRLGNREASYVQVLDGVKLGERIVTRGAYQIRLAAMSSQIPAHGHVH